MKRILLVLLVGAVLSACAATGGRMVEEMDSPSKVSLLRERAEEYWTAAVKADYEKMFYLFDPFFQAKTNKYKFLGSRGAVKYHSFEIKDVKVEGNIGLVNVSIVFSVPPLKVKRQEFSQPGDACRIRREMGLCRRQLVQRIPIRCNRGSQLLAT